MEIYNGLIKFFQLHTLERMIKFMLTLRRSKFLLWGILALFMVTIIPLPVKASDYGTQDLALDSRGSAVRQLQSDLAGLGFYTSAIDGWFGPKTYDAAIDFQKSQKLKTDGVVGPKTKAAITAVLSAQTSKNNSQDLTLGSSSSAVRQLQRDLTKLGFYTRAIDGSFGPKTYDAVISFQKSQQLKADGIVGSKTKTTLNRATTGIVPSSIAAGAKKPTAASVSQYNAHEKRLVDSFRANYQGSPAEALVGRAIWYMEYGFMKYGSAKYWDKGLIDCSNFVSLVYKDFGYKIPTASKEYANVGKKVAGVYSRKMSNSGHYEIVGTNNLKPGDIFIYWVNNTNGRGTHVGHAAIYMGKINGAPAVIHTDSGRPTAIGIRTDCRYWYGEHFMEARRVLPTSAFKAGAKINVSEPVMPPIYQIKPDKPIILPKYLRTGF